MQNAQLKENSSISLEPDFDYNYGKESQPNKAVGKSVKEPTSFNRSNISPDAIIFTNKEGEISYINLEAQELTGWYITDAMNKKAGQVFNIFDPDTMEKLDDPITKVLDTNSKIELTQNIVLKSKDSLKFEIQFKASPKYKDDGELNKVILTFKKLKEIEDVAPKKEERSEKIEKQSKPKELSISDLSFNDIDNEQVKQEKETPLKVVKEEEDSNEISSVVENFKTDTKNEYSIDSDLSIDLEIGDERVSSFSDKDINHNGSKTVKKEDSQLKNENASVYNISKEELEGLETLDFLNDV